MVRQWDVERSERERDRVDRHDQFPSSFHDRGAYVVRFVQFHRTVLFPRLVLPVCLHTHTHTRTHTRLACLHVYLIYISLDLLLSSPVRRPPARPVYMRAHTHRRSRRLLWRRRRRHQRPTVVVVVVRSYNINTIHARILYKSGMARKTTHV